MPFFLIPLAVKAAALAAKKHGAHKVGAKLAAKAKHKKPIRRKKKSKRNEEEE